MDRLRKKQDLLVKLGALFGPLQRLVAFPDDYDEQEKAQTLARYCSEWVKLASEFHEFTLGEPGHSYSIQYVRFHDALYGLQGRLVHGPEALADLVPTAVESARAAIDAVPVPRGSVILEAGTPFSTYCRLRSLCEVDTTASVVWVDAFMAASVFHRYLSDVRPTAQITLVTSEPRPGSSKKDQSRWNEFLDISRLFAQERGNAAYRLVVQVGLLHDRWLAFDSKRIYALGGSAKDAGDRQYFTLSVVEATSQNLQKIQDHIDNGVEYFGPSTPAHR